MTEMSAYQARYALLPDDSRKRCHFNSGYMVFLVVSAVLMFTAATVYVLTVGLHEKLVFPNMKNTVPDVWLHRALVYSNQSGTGFEQAVVGHTRYTKPTPHDSDYKLVCYYMLPSSIETLSFDLKAKKIDADLCTHINAAFALIANNTLYLNEVQLESLKTIVDLKKKNKNLKVLISVGGAGNDTGFPEMVLDHKNRKTFIKSILDYVKTYHLDGIDLDWEFPNEHVGPDRRQKIHFTQLLREIRAEIDRQEKHRFLLSVAVAAPVFMVDNCYDVSYMNGYVDYVNLMSYDYHFYTKITPFTGINAPLYASPSDLGYFATLNINASANHWFQSGMDKRKIVVGLPTYGHSFRLMNPSNNGLMAPASGYGRLGSSGFVDYGQVCRFLTENRISPVFDVELKSPYATKYLEWVSYDDVQSLTYKAEYIKNNNFGGAMVLSLNTDDHRGACDSPSNEDGDSSFPLTKKIKKVLDDQLL